METGLIDEAMDKGTRLVEETQKSLEGEFGSDPVVEVAPTTKVEPKAMPEPEVVNTAKVFKNRLKIGGRGPAMIQLRGEKRQL